MKDICDWCGEVKEIVAEKEGKEEGTPEKICFDCAETIGLVTSDYKHRKRST